MKLCANCGRYRPDEGEVTSGQICECKRIELSADQIKSADSAALQIAITGYMADRNHLISQISALSLQYEYGKLSGNYIREEIIRIDKIVAQLLALAPINLPLP